MSGIERRPPVHSCHPTPPQDSSLTHGGSPLVIARGGRMGGAWVAGCRFPPPSCGRFQVSGSRNRAPEVSGCGPQLPSAPDRRGFREELRDAPCGRLSIVRFDTGPKRSMGHLLGGEKIIFLIRDIDGPAMAAAPVESCQDRGPEVSLGSPRVGTRHV